MTSKFHPKELHWKVEFLQHSESFIYLFQGHPSLVRCWSIECSCSDPGCPSTSSTTPLSQLVLCLSHLASGKHNSVSAHFSPSALFLTSLTSTLLFEPTIFQHKIYPRCVFTSLHKVFENNNSPEIFELWHVHEQHFTTRITLPLTTPATTCPLASPFTTTCILFASLHISPSLPPLHHK